MQGPPCLCCGVWAIEGFEDKTPHRGIWGYIYFSDPTPPRIFLIWQFTLRKQDFITVNFAKLCDTSSGFQPNFSAKFPDSPWTFGIQVLWLSVTLARNELQGSHIFPNSKFNEFNGYSRRRFTSFQGHFTHDVYLSLRLHLPLKQVFLLSMHYTLLSFTAHYPWFNLICITINRNAFRKVWSI